jgi:hypothetical protein
MYLRRTSRTNRDGSKVEYLALAHNTWNPETRRAEPEVLFNFGRTEELDRPALLRLCAALARACGVDFDPGLGHDPSPPESVRLIRSRDMGVPHVVAALWERLDIGPALRAAQEASRCTVPYEKALLAMVTNRLHNPESKLGVWSRWLDTVHLPQCQGLELGQMYEAMDLLHKHAAEVEERVFFHVADLLNLDVDVVFFDTTTASFSIDEPDGEDGLRRFGHSKEGTWTAQVVVALAVTRSGIPVRSWVFPGNAPDVSMIKKVREDLRGWKLGRSLLVADAGTDSKENREELVKGAGRYLLAVRAGSVKEVHEEVLSRPGRYKKVGEGLEVKEVQVGEGELRRRYFVCWNESEAHRQAAHRAAVLDELRATLTSHTDLAATQKWAMELATSGRYGRYVHTVDGKVAINQTAVAKAERLEGKWVLVTNDDTLSPADAATGYRALLVIERAFRSLKSTQIEMTPMYHWVPRRIEAHVRICVLALMVQRVAELAAGMPWARIADRLGRVHATEWEGAGHHFLQRTELDAEVTELLEKLAVQAPKRVLSVARKAPSA